MLKNKILIQSFLLFALILGSTFQWSNFDSILVNNAVGQELIPDPPDWFPPQPPHTWMESYKDSRSTDSIPYLIVTSQELKPVFDDYAEWKRKKGIPAEVKTISEINTSYDGDFLQEKIREWVRYRYVNNHSRWLLIGGDYDHVPTISVDNRRKYIVSDYYYSSLDFDWNDDGDTIFGEPSCCGDTTDSFAEVYLGRIPAKDTFQARVLINKLIAYELDTSKSQHQTRALITTTDIIRVNETSYGDSLAEAIPGHFHKTRLHSQEPSTVQDSLLAGYGIIINSSHAQNYRNFLTLYTIDGWPNRGITCEFFDTTTTAGLYSIFINSTCHYGSILNDTTMARSYLFNPDGWGIGYLGTIYDDAAAATTPLYKGVLEYVFDSNCTEIGKAISLARDDYQIYWTFPYYLYERFIGLTLHYFGDPQTNIYTETPKVFDVSHQRWMAWDLDKSRAANYNVTVTSQSMPVESALVCLSFEDDVYELGYTDANGEISFGYLSDIADSTYGFGNLFVSKANFFTDTSTVHVIEYGHPGDANADESLDISDAVYVINYVNDPGFPPPPIMNRADANADCGVNISDAVWIINWVYEVGGYPLVGCYEIPWGGKLSGNFDDPVDNEYVPADLEQSEAFQTSIKLGKNRNKLLQLNSQRAVRAISLRLEATNGNTINVENLLPDQFGPDLFWSQNGSLVKIAYIDTSGLGEIPTGPVDLASITGDFKVVRSMVVVVGPDGEISTLGSEINYDDDWNEEIIFKQNYPNPFNPITNFEFSLPVSTHARLDIYNILGQNVATLLDDDLASGKHTITWQGTDDNGNELAAGVYFSKFQSGDFVTTRKLILLK